MLWTGINAADTNVTIDGVNYILDTSTGTAKVTTSSDYYYNKSLVIPPSIKYTNRTFEVTEIDEKAFQGAPSSSSGLAQYRGASSISLPNTIIKIGKSAFYYNSTITSIKIPENVNRIEPYTFQGCGSLISVDLPQGITYIGDGAFGNCGSLISVDLPEGITYIGSHAFDGCSILSEITIPSSLTYMGSRAFFGCTHLKTIVWNAKHCNDFVSADEAPFVIGQYQGYSSAYYYNANIITSSITFGEEVEYIPAYLCWNLLNISTLIIPNSIKEIGDYAFYVHYQYNKNVYLNDNQLNSVSFGTGLEKIGSYAFYGRGKLSSVTIPDKCMSIGTGAFAFCSNLSTISLGKGITSIGTYTFNACPYINTINIYATTPPVIAKDVFYNISDLMAVTLNVRSKALDAYKSATVWKDMYVQAMENDIRTFTLSVSSADESKGTTTQGGAYDEDSEILIYAAAKSGYKFSKWNDGSTDNPRTVKMIGNLSFVAQFEPFIPVPTYTITANAKAIEGTAVGSGVYEAGTQATLAAIGNTGYHFVKWADGNTANPRQVTVTADGSYVAQFAKDAAKYILTTSSTNASQGTAYGQGKYEEGTNVAIFAVANDGYHFTQWHDGNVENPRMVTVSNDAMFFANFAQDPVAPTLYEVKIKPENTTQGWTTEGGSFGLGTQIMIYAHPTNGYEFSQWSDGNTENPRFLTITKAVELNAKFKVQSPSGIRSTSATTTGTPIRKVVRNGRAFIEYGDKTYTTQGVEVK